MVKINCGMLIALLTLFGSAWSAFLVVTSDLPLMAAVCIIINLLAGSVGTLLGTIRANAAQNDAVRLLRALTADMEKARVSKLW